MAKITLLFLPDRHPFLLDKMMAHRVFKGATYGSLFSRGMASTASYRMLRRCFDWLLARHIISTIIVIHRIT
jgi:hypothetical protein